MALRDTRLTPCNNVITYQFDNKFKYAAQNDNIPDNNAMEVGGSHVSQKNVSCLDACACVALCIVFVYFQRRKTIFLYFADKIKGSEGKQTPPAKDKR